tara:strand:+ start:498 stop:1124 length:627 start_codon:yes stop_codon:yes gene_type:complete
MNQKNALGLNSCFLDLNDPIELFRVWMDEAKKTEPNDPTAFSLATSKKNGIPSVRMILLKDFSEEGFAFYTNLESQKSKEIKENPNAAMCFHWKSLQRQIRVSGSISKIKDELADKYYETRSYESKIGAWASKQSSTLKDREQLIKSIEEYKLKHSDKKNVPRPDYWSGWNLSPINIEFWLRVDGRIHERLLYTKNQKETWNKSLLSP